MSNQSNRGGDHANHEQHTKSGQQNHKSDASASTSNPKHASPNPPSQSGSHEQQAKTGQPNRKND
jgi:hypothetical protein